MNKLTATSERWGWALGHSSGAVGRAMAIARLVGISLPEVPHYLLAANILLPVQRGAF